MNNNRTGSKNIILIGYRATGKSTLSRLLSERLGLPCVDSDVVIEQKAGKTISKVFAEDGETAFRDLEETVIRDLLDKETGGYPNGVILATGGGAILRKTTRDLLRSNGLTVWLCASPDTVLKRMSGDATTGDRRPNLTNLPPRDEIVKLLNDRESFYRETAKITLDTDSVPIESLVETILRNSSFC
ncbi:MAG: shikimate kinase [Thermoguttaceae bacterium]